MMFNTRNNGRNRNNHKRLIPYSKLDNFIIDLANTIYFFTWLAISQNQLQRSDKTLFNAVMYTYVYLVKVTAGINLPLSLYGWYQTKRDMNYQCQSIGTELQKTHQFVNKIKNDTYRLKRAFALANARYNIEYPLEICLSRNNISISWTIGNGDLKRQFEKLNNIIENLDKRYQMDSNYRILRNNFQNNITKNIPLIAKPKSLYQPHISHKIDFPSKARQLNYKGVIAFLVTTALCDSNDLKKNPMQFFALLLFFAIILSTVAKAESYVLNKSKQAINLEGFTNLNQPYDEWPPTCIGQQLTEQLVLYPSNEILNAVVDYFGYAKKFFEELESKGLLNIDNIDLKDDIDLFLKFIDAKDNNYPHRFSIFEKRSVNNVNSTLNEPQITKQLLS